MRFKIKNLVLKPIKDKNSLTVTSKFGKRSIYNKKTKKYTANYHKGIDLISGTYITSVADGIVSSIRKNVKGYTEKYPSGNYVTINHGNKVYTTYCHLKENSITVKVGSRVSKNQVIGKMGSTGRTTGKHLHFGIKINSKFVDPEDFLLGKKTLIRKSIKVYYIVKKGDNLSKIAKFYNTTWQHIYETNKEIIGNNPNLIKVGQKLLIEVNHE